MIPHTKQGIIALHEAAKYPSLIKYVQPKSIVTNYSYSCERKYKNK